MHTYTGKGWHERAFSGIARPNGAMLLPSQVTGLAWIDSNRDGRAELRYFNTKDKCWMQSEYSQSQQQYFAPRCIEYLSYDEGDVMSVVDWDADGAPGTATLEAKSGNLYAFQDNQSTDAIQALRLTKITRGFGLSTKIGYGLLTDSQVYTPVPPGLKSFGRCVHNTEVDVCSAVPQWVVPWSVVSRVEQTSPSFSGETYQATAVVTQRYHYQQLLAQGGGRGLLGFSRMSVHDVASNTTSSVYYRQDFPYTGMPRRSVRYLGGRLDSESDENTNAQRLSDTYYNYIVKRLHNQKVFAPVLQTQIENHYQANNAIS